MNSKLANSAIAAILVLAAATTSAQPPTAPERPSPGPSQPSPEPPPSATQTPASPPEPPPPDGPSPPPSEIPEPDSPIDVGRPPTTEPDPPLEDSTLGAPPPDSGSPYHIRYVLERIHVTGNARTHREVIRNYVPMRPGSVIHVDDLGFDAVRYRLLGTGWFENVRLRLARGSRRGWVVLVVEVEERNTLVITQVTAGITEGVRNSEDRSVDILPYAGVAVADTNLFGMGTELELTGVLSKRQHGIRARFTDPRALGSSFLFNAAAFYLDARDFFGNDPLVSITCPPRTSSDPDERCPPEVEARNAVVLYRRFGGSLGTGHDIGSFARFTLDWQGEGVRVDAVPDAASERRGDDVQPIDFSINRGRSFVSTLKVGLKYDDRDDPALASRGTFVSTQADAGTRMLGSDYEFLRIQALFRHWFPIPWWRGHSIRVGVFGGVVFGRAPFFYQFYVSDLTDLIPSRVLELNLDRRPPPNFFGTSIEVMRSEELAGRVDIEYGLPLYRGRGGIRAINAYAGVGLYALADRSDLKTAIPGYRGFARIPIDLTFDLGFRADTQIGVFQLGFSNLLGFVTP